MKPTLRTRMLWTGARAKQGMQAVQRFVGPGAAPDLLIVGAQKAGTTSLFNYLEKAPGFHGSRRKEVRFFNSDENYARGVGWYERFFDARKSGVRFEATPEYLYEPRVPERIHAHYPDMRIVILLREPVSRAYSAWNMYRAWAESGFMPLAMHRARHQNPLYDLFFTGTPPSFEEYVDHEMALMEQERPPLEPGILRRGIYVDQVGRYLDTFGKDRVLVLGFGELTRNPRRLVERVVGFAGGRSGNEASLGSMSNDTFNQGTYPSRCPAHVAERLEAFYAPFNTKLIDRLGVLPSW